MTANDFSFRAATITDVPALAQLHVATIVETHGGPQLRRSRPGPALLYTINLITGAATTVASTAIQAGSLEFGPDGLLYAGGTGSNGGNLYRITH